MKPQIGLEVDHTDEGDSLSVPDVNSDAGVIVYLLEFARRRGFAIGPMIRVGKIALQVTDLRQATQGNVPDMDALSEEMRIMREQE